MKDFKVDKHSLGSEDVKRLGIWKDRASLEHQLYKSDQREDCVLIQAGAFVVDGMAYLLLGVGAIVFLDSLSQIEDVDGIIGDGNVLFLNKDCTHVHSAISRSEFIEQYELGDQPERVKYIESAPLGSIIFLFRAEKDREALETIEAQHGNGSSFKACGTFSDLSIFVRHPERFAGTRKARLARKFVDTSSTVHCTFRPTLKPKGTLFSERDEIRSAINNFKGEFALGYAEWCEILKDTIGLKLTRALSDEYYNPADPITPKIIEMVKSKKPVS